MRTHTRRRCGYRLGDPDSDCLSVEPGSCDKRRGPWGVLLTFGPTPSRRPGARLDCG